MAYIKIMARRASHALAEGYWFCSRPKSYFLAVSNFCPNPVPIGLNRMFRPLFFGMD